YAAYGRHAEARIDRRLREVVPCDSPLEEHDMRRMKSRRTIRYAFATAIAGYALVGVCAIAGSAAQSSDTTAGVYAAAQAARGKALYEDQCVGCHGDWLEGVEGPPLAGKDSLADYAGHPVAEVIQRVQSTMPRLEPGTLTRAQAIDLTAFILQSNEWPAGAERTEGTANDTILLAPKPAPPAKTAPPAKAAPRKKSRP